MSEREDELDAPSSEDARMLADSESDDDEDEDEIE